MRLVCVSDIHMQRQNIPLLREKVGVVPTDAVIACGDFTSHGSSGIAEEMLKELKPMGKVFALPGNLDTKKVAETLENKGASIHNKAVVFGEYLIAGFGGSLKGDAGNIHFSERVIEKSLSNLLPAENSKTILVTHLPPFGTSLDVAGNRHIGSKAVKKIIEEKQPLLHLCGHAHDSAGEELFGRTLSVNVGALKDGKAAIVDLDGKIKIEKIRLFE